MQVRLTRKFSDVLNGLDLRAFSIGQILELDDMRAAMLMAEGWAEPLLPAPLSSPDAPAGKQRPRIEPA